jgi:hypothetical protein
MAETILKPITDATPFIPGQQTQPTVTALTDGRFVAVWSEFRSTTSFDEIYARVLNADGSFAGPAFQADGSFVVAWANILAGQTERDIVVRRFDADGTPLGDQVVVNTTTEGYQMRCPR